MSRFSSQFFPVLKKALGEARIPEEVYIYIINYVIGQGDSSDFHLMRRANTVIRKYLQHGDVMALQALEDGIGVMDWYNNFNQFVAPVLYQRTAIQRVVPV